MRETFRQHGHVLDRLLQYALDGNGEVPGILGSDNRSRVFVLHEHLDTFVFHAAADKAEKQPVISLCAQREVEPGFDRLLLGP